MQQPIWLPVSYDGGKLQVELCTFNTATFEASFILNVRMLAVRKAAVLARGLPKVAVLPCAAA